MLKKADLKYYRIMMLRLLFILFIFNGAVADSYDQRFCRYTNNINTNSHFVSACQQHIKAYRQVSDSIKQFDTGNLDIDYSNFPKLIAATTNNKDVFIIIHGLGLSPGYLQDMAWYIHNNFPNKPAVIMPLLNGHGLSDQQTAKQLLTYNDNPYKNDQLVPLHQQWQQQIDEAVNVAYLLGTEDVNIHIVGHSLGGVLAMDKTLRDNDVNGTTILFAPALRLSTLKNRILLGSLLFLGKIIPGTGFNVAKFLDRNLLKELGCYSDDQFELPLIAGYQIDDNQLIAQPFFYGWLSRIFAYELGKLQQVVSAYPKKDVPILLTALIDDHQADADFAMNYIAAFPRHEIIVLDQTKHTNMVVGKDIYPVAVTYSECSGLPEPSVMSANEGFEQLLSAARSFVVDNSY